MPSIKNFSSVTPIPNTNKVCVRYRRCRYFHNKAFIAIFGCYLVISLGVIGKLFILNGPYFEAAIVFFMFLWIPIWFLWDGYVTYRNRKIERSLVYPIIDKRLAENEAKYPSRCKVRKRRLIKEPKEKSAFVPPQFRNPTNSLRSLRSKPPRMRFLLFKLAFCHVLTDMIV